jgi:hypothetical protein
LHLARHPVSTIALLPLRISSILKANATSEGLRIFDILHVSITKDITSQHQISNMPPRKSDSSKAATIDEGSVAGVGASTSTGPSTSTKKEDGVNIEVMAHSSTVQLAFTT